MKTGFATINRCRTKDDGDADEAEGSTRISAGKEEKICSGYAGKNTAVEQGTIWIKPSKIRSVAQEILCKFVKSNKVFEEEPN